MSDPRRAIEDIFRRRFEREALVVPSGRLALLLAFQELLSPGDRLLMSPVNDDVVFFTVLAGGLVPVLAPLDPATGNIDPAAVDDATWRRVRGVLTTNLYGTPDCMDLISERCRRHNLVLIEDACHALGTSFGGRPVGAFGDAAAFSFGKHLDSAGGLLTLADRGRRAAIVRRAATAVRPRPARRVLADALHAGARRLLAATGTRDLVRRLRPPAPPSPARAGTHRIPYALEDVQDAQRRGGLDAFDGWVRVDDRDYRTERPASALRETLDRLRGFEATRPSRLAGIRRLLALGLTPPAVAAFADTPLLRVPLLVHDRETVIAALKPRGMRFHYIYDPPLDVYARPELAERLASPPEAVAWSRDVLPVDPLDADRFLTLLAEHPGLVRPAGPADAGGG